MGNRLRPSDGRLTQWKQLHRRKVDKQAQQISKDRCHNDLVREESMAQAQQYKEPRASPPKA